MNEENSFLFKGGHLAWRWNFDWLSDHGSIFQKKKYLKTFEQRSLCDNEKLIHTYTYDLVKQSYLH